MVRPAFGENRSGPTGPDAGGRRTIVAAGEAEAETRESQKPARRRCPQAADHRGALPKDLPREDVVVDLADKNCRAAGACGSRSARAHRSGST